MKGAAAIPELRLQRLQKLIESFTRLPQLLLMNLFGEDKWDSDTIEWEAQIGNRGMTPFAAEDGPAKRVAPSGVSAHEARAAFWKEKMYLGASFLNNLRKAGTVAQWHRAKKYLAQQSRMMRGRCDRRKEWLFAKMFSGTDVSYLDPNGNRVSVDWGIPDANLVALGATRYWDTGADKNIVEDIMDAKIAMSNNNAGKLDYALFTSEILKLLILDTGVQTLLTKSAFGQGDLFARPQQVLGNLFGIDHMVVYDEQVQIRTWLTAALSAGAGPHTVYVEDTTDFEVADTLRVVNPVNKTWEEITISAVSHSAGTITATGTLSNSYKALRDHVQVTRKFLPTTKFCMFASQVEGQKIAEFANAPFMLERVYGMKVDTHPTWDPDGIFIRVQNKGLPVLYFEDAPYILTVTA